MYNKDKFAFTTYLKGRDMEKNTLIDYNSDIYEIQSRRNIVANFFCKLKSMIMFLLEAIVIVAQAFFWIVGLAVTTLIAFFALCSFFEKWNKKK